MAIDVPFEEFQGFDVIEDNGTFTVSGSGMSIWKAKQRAYYYGQDRIIGRIEIYNAVLHVAALVWKDEDSDIDVSTFRNEQLEIGYDHSRPLSEYMKKRREYVKSQRKNGKSTGD
jgi:hypothetical protein